LRAGPHQIAAAIARRESAELEEAGEAEWGNFFFTAQAGQRQAYLDARKPENRKLLIPFAASRPV
jgi:hypothetical protein